MARSLLKVKPGDVALIIALARTLIWQEKDSEAGELLEVISKEDEGNSEALWLLGCAYENQKKFDQAVQVFKKALQLNRRVASIHYELGRIYNNFENKNRNKEAARRHFRHATEGEDAIAEAFIERVLIETPERANYVLKKGLKKFPDHARMNGILCWRLLNSDDAQGTVEAVDAAGSVGVE